MNLALIASIVVGAIVGLILLYALMRRLGIVLLLLGTDIVARVATEVSSGRPIQEALLEVVLRNPIAYYDSLAPTNLALSIAGLSLWWLILFSIIHPFVRNYVIKKLMGERSKNVSLLLSFTLTTLFLYGLGGGLPNISAVIGSAVAPHLPRTLLLGVGLAIAILLTVLFAAGLFYLLARVIALARSLFEKARATLLRRPRELSLEVFCEILRKAGVRYRVVEVEGKIPEDAIIFFTEEGPRAVIVELEEEE